MRTRGFPVEFNDWRKVDLNLKLGLWTEVKVLEIVFFSYILDIRPRPVPLKNETIVLQRSWSRLLQPLQRHKPIPPLKHLKLPAKQNVIHRFFQGLTTACSISHFHPQIDARLRCPRALDHLPPLQRHPSRGISEAFVPSSTIQASSTSFERSEHSGNHFLSSWATLLKRF